MPHSPSAFMAALVALSTLLPASRATAQMFLPPPPPPPIAPYGNAYGFPPQGFPQQGFPQQAMPPTGNRCASRAGVCFLPGIGPAGAPCACQTPYGAAPGQILP